MNSMSRTHFEDCDPCKKERKHCPVILKCGPIGGGTLTTTTATGATATVASLPLDTSKLCDPCVKLEVESAVVSTVATTLTFQVFKLCRGMLAPIPVGPAWTLAVTTSAAIVSFFVCDCGFCPEECCTYTLVATSPAGVAATITLTNAQLAAIATCGTISCC